MSAKQSEETKHAIYLHEIIGLSIAEAAKKANIFPSTLYRALRRRNKGNAKKKVDDVA